jgi:hypothetical protein
MGWNNVNFSLFQTLSSWYRQTVFHRLPKVSLPRSYSLPPCLPEMTGVFGGQPPVGINASSNCCVSELPMTLFDLRYCQNLSLTTLMRGQSENGSQMLPFPLCAMDINISSNFLDDPVTDGKSQTRSLANGFGCVKWIEHAC